MKNIHVLPTDKPSRLLVRNDKPFVLMLKEHSPFATNETHTNQNIYITNDEEIKERDWLFSSKTNNIFKADSIEYLESHNVIEDFDKSFYINSKYSKKIILTTDQDLIKDGVQAIEDEFLEWFVKNPSCEFVEVVKEGFKKNDMIDEATSYKYKIIIPQEEPKQERSYSEEDMKEAIRFGFDKGFCSNSSNKVKNTLPSEREWFEQFKKK